MSARLKPAEDVFRIEPRALLQAAPVKHRSLLLGTRRFMASPDVYVGWSFFVVLV